MVNESGWAAHQGRIDRPIGLVDAKHVAADAELLVLSLPLVGQRRSYDLTGVFDDRFACVDVASAEETAQMNGGTGDVNGLTKRPALHLAEATLRRPIDRRR